MPKTTSSGAAKDEELPSTLRRSDDKAKRTFAKAHDSAAEEYGEGERAHRVAYSALKHTHEKVGDHWEPKQEAGPSDARAGVDVTPRRTRRVVSTPTPPRSICMRSPGAWTSLGVRR